MFDEDDDFEIDEEFLVGVYDAERSAVTNDLSLNPTQCNSPDALSGTLETFPGNKRKSSSPPSTPIVEKQTCALRTSEDTACLVASAVLRSAPQGGGLAKSSRISNCPPALGDNVFEHSPGANNSSSPEIRGSKSSTSNICSSEVTFNLNASRVRQRKFPGPAGLLPDRGRLHGQGQRPNFSSISNISGSDLDEAEEPLSLCSQATASVLEDGPWRTLQRDFADGGKELLQRYSVAWIKQKAAARQLVGQKVPFLAAVLHSIDCSSPDPCVVLRDSTGEIPGTLHRSVWDSFGGQLIAGSALVLHLVGVLSTGISARRHYLNITSNNIVTIYSSPLCEPSMQDSTTRVRKTDVKNWAINQLLQTANSWEEQRKRKKDAGGPPMFQRDINTSSNSVIPPLSTLSARNACSSSSSPLQTPARNNNVPGVVANSSIYGSVPMPPPPQAPRSNSSHHPLQRDSSSSVSPQVTTNRSFPQESQHVPSQKNGQNCDLSRQDMSKPNTVCTSSVAQNNRFVPKRPTFSFSSLNRNDYGQKISDRNVQETSASQTSHDLFSDADDLDISSVLDGIDSESLFGDF